MPFLFITLAEVFFYHPVQHLSGPVLTCMDEEGVIWEICPVSFISIPLAAVSFYRPVQHGSGPVLKGMVENGIFWNFVQCHFFP